MLPTLFRKVGVFSIKTVPVMPPRPDSQGSNFWPFQENKKFTTVRSKKGRLR